MSEEKNKKPLPHPTLSVPAAGTERAEVMHILKLPSSRAEFGLWNWAAGAGSPKQDVTQFGQGAMRAAVRAVAADAIKHGRPLPQWVAEALREAK